MDMSYVDWKSMLHLSVNSPMSKNAICLCNSLGIDVVTSFRRCVDYDTGKRIVCDSYCYEPKLFVAVRKNLEKSKETMVIANLDTKHIIGIYETVNGNTRVLFFPSMVYSDIIDLNSQGCRWEGDCQEGKPCGWGRYYDESNRLSYEGFRYDKFNVCYGTYYYKDTVNEQPKYKGQMAFNYKHGYGKLYDRTGALVYDGGYFYSEQCENITVTVPDGTKQRQYHNTMMAHYAIGKMCYMERSKLELIDYPCLETLDIGGMSYSSFQMSGSMRIIDCPRLRKITISVSSFTGFNVLELKSENDDGDGR